MARLDVGPLACVRALVGGGPGGARGTRLDARAGHRAGTGGMHSVPDPAPSRAAGHLCRRGDTAAALLDALVLRAIRADNLSGLHACRHRLGGRTQAARDRLRPCRSDAVWPADGALRQLVVGGLAREPARFRAAAAARALKEAPPPR